MDEINPLKTFEPFCRFLSGDASAEDCRCRGCWSGAVYPDEELADRLEAADRMYDAAEAGRFLLEREAAQLDDLLIGPAVALLIDRDIPARAARRAYAKTLWDRIEAVGSRVFILHGRVRVLPPLLSPERPALSLAVREYESELGDLYDEQQCGFLDR